MCSVPSVAIGSIKPTISFAGARGTPRRRLVGIAPIDDLDMQPVRQSLDHVDERLIRWLQTEFVAFHPQRPQIHEPRSASCTIRADGARVGAAEKSALDQLAGNRITPYRSPA